MEYTEKYKEGVFKLFEKELNKCEILYNPNTNGIWFINRETKYWYLEYKVEDNFLWWRHQYFNRIIKLFAMPNDVFEKLISEWVENKLNREVLTTQKYVGFDTLQVEDTLNCKVLTTMKGSNRPISRLEETLNCKVDTTGTTISSLWDLVKETLNCKVDDVSLKGGTEIDEVEDMLKSVE